MENVLNIYKKPHLNLDSELSDPTFTLFGAETHTHLHTIFEWMMHQVYISSAKVKGAAWYPSVI